MLSGFELGHIEFMCNEKIGSSYGKTPDQSMMIFLTLSNLLSGLFEFKVKELNYIEILVIDSSFRIIFKRKKDKILLIVNNEAIVETELINILTIIYDSAKSFCDKQLDRMTTENSVKLDLLESLEQVKSILNEFK